MAEDAFKNSVTRAIDGKFIVDLPFKLNPFESLGDSFVTAKNRYKSLARKLDKDKQLKEQYDAVLEEYVTLGHMELVNDDSSFQYFSPHH